MREKIWVYHNELTEDEILNLSARFGLPRVIAVILANRKINTELAVKNYIVKPMSCIHNPMLMKDMQKAAQRLKSAVEKKEKIVIYGDYDVDGITSTSLLYMFLTSLGADVSYYIPDRIGEGYGINIMAINKLIKEKTDLVVTVDCGITAVGEAEFARLAGLDMIITDHHTCKEKIPNAFAVVNPKQPDCEYPFKELSGVGVAFKLVLAVTMEMGGSTNECFRKYCDIAAIGTIADVVPLTDENRVIVDRGLQRLADTNLVGVKMIFEIAGVLGKPITGDTVAFALSPRLNAAGRLGSAQTAVELMLETDEKKAYETALRLNEDNRKRQLTEQEIFNDAMAMIRQDKDFEKKKVIVLAKEGWHHGVIGIVASRINDRFYKPCILITYENGVGKGSGRSIAGFNLFDALSAVSDDLVDFGGHAIAAGLSINTDKLADFEKDINDYAKKVLKPEDMIPHITVDTRISPFDVTLENAKMLLKLEPYGMGNRKPVFSINGVKIAYISQMGNENKHLRLRLVSQNKYINAVGFGMGEYFDSFKTDDTVDIAFMMEVNCYQGMEQVQVRLLDMKMHSEDCQCGEME